jgi:hypothetical protein
MPWNLSSDNSWKLTICAVCKHLQCPHLCSYVCFGVLESAKASGWLGVPPQLPLTGWGQCYSTAVSLTALHFEPCSLFENKNWNFNLLHYLGVQNRNMLMLSFIFVSFILYYCHVAMREETQNAYRLLVRNWPLWRVRKRWKDDIKMDLRL